MTLSYTTDPSPTAPLACDCLGAVVYLKLLAAYRALTRDGHGVLRAQLVARFQDASGAWTYNFEIDESGLVDPPQAISSGMIQSICCEGCLGFAFEAFNQAEFGGWLVDTGTLVTAGEYSIRHTIRPILIQDVKAWVTTADASINLTAHVIVDGVQVTVNPIRIAPGSLVSDGSHTFQGGDKTQYVQEGSVVSVRVDEVGPAISGLEIWFFGHLNPSPYT